MDECVRRQTAALRCLIEAEKRKEEMFPFTRPLMREEMDRHLSRMLRYGCVCFQADAGMRVESEGAVGLRHVTLMETDDTDLSPDHHLRWLQHFRGRFHGPSWSGSGPSQAAGVLWLRRYLHLTAAWPQQKVLKHSGRPTQHSVGSKPTSGGSQGRVGAAKTR